MKLDVSLPTLDSYENFDKYIKIEEYPWDIESNSVDEVLSVHAIQKVQDLLSYFSEIYRVSKNDTIVRFIAPYYTHERGNCDPTNIRRIGEITFAHLDSEFRKVNKCDFGGWEKLNFKIRGMAFTWVDEPFNMWKNKSEEAKLFAKKHYWNVVEDIIIDLNVKK